jgi:Caspase domain
VGKTLHELYNFQIEEIRNATDDQILAKLTEYLHRSFQPQDQLLIFFSGHGYFDPDLRKGFIVPANALRVPDDVGHRSLLAHETIMDYVNRIPSQHVVLVLDACFAGALDRRIADDGLRGDPSTDIYAHASLPDILARKEPKRTRRYITSGGKDFVPDGLPGHHSPFISAFLVTLNQGADRKGYLTLDDIQQGLDTVIPEPRWGDIQQDNDPGADFLLLTPTAIAKLNSAN